MKKINQTTNQENQPFFGDVALLGLPQQSSCSSSVENIIIQSIRRRGDYATGGGTKADHGSRHSVVIRFCGDEEKPLAMVKPPHFFGFDHLCLFFFLTLIFGHWPSLISSASDPSPLPASDSAIIPANSTQSSPITQSQLIKPSADDGRTEAKTPSMKVTRQSPPMPEAITPGGTSPFGGLKPESKDEMFARIDADRDNEITLEDYMKRDRFYVESVRTEFNDIDTNRDGKVSKAEFDAFVRRLDEQRKAAMLDASKFTLQKNDGNSDGELSVDELGTYINGTLQRNVAHLPEVFRQYDRDGNKRLNLDEFHELDFNFPWDKFPPNDPPNRQIFFNGAGAQLPPFMAEQSAPVPTQLMQSANRPNGPLVIPSQPLPVRYFQR